MELSDAMQLVEPITQGSGIDTLVQGLSALVLGIVYDYDREPGPIPRSVTTSVFHH
jgi:intracellular protein transport protein USO1